MASNFPKLPGYVPTHDPTIVSHKKVSHVKLEKNRNGNNVEVPLYAVPKPPAANFRPEKEEMSKSLSQVQYVNHIGGDMNEQFEPTFVKLDKQVSLPPLALKSTLLTAETGWQTRHAAHTS
jgi:hypothetical protein